MNPNQGTMYPTVSMQNWNLSPGQAQLVWIQPINNPIDEKRSSTPFTILGALELFLGIISVACGIRVVTLKSMYYSVSVWGAFGTGIWCGVFFIVAGILGAISGRRTDMCPVIGGMVMSIFSALAGVTLLGMSVPAITYVSSIESRGPEEETNFACHIILSVCGISALIVSIVHASYCCSVACCLNNRQNCTAAYYTPVQLPPPQGLLCSSHTQENAGQRFPPESSSTLQSHQTATLGSPPKYDMSYPS